MLIKCKRCGAPILNAKTGTMCTSCGSTVSFADVMEAAKLVRMGKAHGYVGRYQVGKDGEIEECQFPTTHRGRRRFVVKQKEERCLT